MAKADGASTTLWMPLAEAVKRAGSLEALLPHLRAGRIVARYQKLYSWPGGDETESEPGNIPRGWWDDAGVDPNTGQIVFAQEDPLSNMIVGEPEDPSIIRKVFAMGVALEHDAVARLFPVAASAFASPAKKMPPVSLADLTNWYVKTYLPPRRIAGDPPSREQDEAAAGNHFKGFNVPREWLRNLRRDHAPKAWTKAGRKPSG